MDNLPPKGSKTLAEAFRILFRVDINRYESIKHSLNSLIKSKLIIHTKIPLSYGKDGRSRIFIHSDQLDTLHNAVLLHGVFGETRTITGVFKDSEPFMYRQKMAEMTRIALVNRQSALGLLLLPRELHEFLDLLGGDADLKSVRLPNPFHELPQLSEDRHQGIIRQLLTQSALLSNGDNMMLHYLNDDLESAWVAAQSLDVDDPRLAKYRALIEREYRQASEFDELLESLK